MSFPTNNTTKANAKDLRQNMTIAEKRLWQRLRANQLGVKFRRQVPIGSYVVDFFTFTGNLAIELDGSQHYEQDAIEYDNIRTDYLKSLDITVIRYNNLDVMKNLDGVVENILRYLPVPPTEQGIIKTSYNVNVDTLPQPLPKGGE